MYRAQLSWRPVAVLLGLSLVWGANMAIVKIGTLEISPLFMAGVRSLVAAFCLYAWMKFKKISLYPSKAVLIHGVVIGAMFGTEFGLVYVGLQHTTASRTYVLLYSAPFFVALGAHFFLKGDRLNSWKVSGLILAFCGVVLLFIGDMGNFGPGALSGDIMALLAGALWGGTTVYIKRFMADRTIPLQTLFYQVSFSAPLLLGMGVLLENPLISGFSRMTAFSVFYQCIIIAFLSYLVWFELIHHHPVSLLHGFSFFTPVFGVFLSGALMLGEIMNPKLLAALGLVSVGMVLVNRKPAPRVIPSNRDL